MTKKRSRAKTANFTDAMRLDLKAFYENENLRIRKNQFGLMKPVTQLTKENVPGRNDPCPCASGKKFKRCCA